MSTLTRTFMRVACAELYPGESMGMLLIDEANCEHRVSGQINNPHDLLALKQALVVRVSVDEHGAVRQLHAPNGAYQVNGG